MNPESDLKSQLLKQFSKSNYLPTEQALAELEQIPIPGEKDKSEIANPVEVKPDNPPPDMTMVIGLEERIIDENPADNGSNKTQDDWIDYFNARNELMVSMPDLYGVGKLNNQKLLDSLRKDSQQGLIITSTRIHYEDKTNARIIHNYGSRLVKSVEHKVVILEYRHKLLADVLDTKEGLKYLQVLFATNDDAPQIKDTLQKLSNYPLDKITVWSGKLLDRPTEMISGFFYNLKNYNTSLFHVAGDLSKVNLSSSRAVRIINPNNGGLK